MGLIVIFLSTCHECEFVVFAQRIWVLEFAPPFLILNYLYFLGESWIHALKDLGFQLSIITILW
jgi:hypothetical protein